MTIEPALLTRVSHRDREIIGPRMRGLLALLADDLRTGCGTARLVDGLWPDEQPENPTKALQILVSRVRSQLGPDVVASTPTGHRLAPAEEQVDSSAVLLSAAESAARARAGDHAEALAPAEAGLGLWDGAPVAVSDVHDDDPVSVLRAARAPAHAALVRARALALALLALLALLARLGRRAEAAQAGPELAGVLPRDEEVLLALLRCEADAGPGRACHGDGADRDPAARPFRAAGPVRQPRTAGGRCRQRHRRPRGGERARPGVRAVGRPADTRRGRCPRPQPDRFRRGRRDPRTPCLDRLR